MSENDSQIVPTSSRVASQSSVEVDDVDEAILQAREAAAKAGFDMDRSPQSPEEVERAPREHWGLTSFAYRVEGLESAVDATTVETELNNISGVQAAVVYSTGMVWISAEDQVSLTQIQEVLEKHNLDSWLTDSSLRRRAARLEIEETRRRMRRHASAHRRAWAAAESRKRRDAGKVEFERFRRNNPFDPTEGLHTARQLITRMRLIVAVLLGLPVVVMQLVSAWQFDYWQWICLALATPVVTWCAWPFHRAFLGGLRRGQSALDGASSVAILLAYVYSACMLIFSSAGNVGWQSHQVLFAGVWSAQHLEGAVFFDVACGGTILLLFGRLLSRRTALRSKSILSVLTVPAAKEVTVVRKTRKSKTEKKNIPIAEIRTGDDIIIPTGMMVPSDGEIISGKSLVDMGPVGGLHRTFEVSVGDRIYAGARNHGAALKMRVHATGSSTRLAAMHRWVRGSALDETRLSQLTNRTASLLVPWAFGLAIVDFIAWLAITKSVDAAMATVLSLLAVVAPVALALSAPLALRLGLWRAATSGALLRDTGTIHKLAEVDAIIFNRVGTLTEGPMHVIGVTPSKGENPDLILRVAGALSLESNHAVSRALVRADREARDAGTGGEGIPHWLDVGEVKITKDGTFEGMVELPVEGEMRNVKARLWRPHDLGEVRDPHLATAVLSGGSPVIVSWKGKDRGVISLADSFKDDAPAAIDRLEDMQLETYMLSRDIYPVARRTANSIGISTVLAGIAPNRKEATVRGVHAAGVRVAMVGDSDVLGALRVADVGILMASSNRIDPTASEVADVVMQREDVSALPELVNLVRHVRNTTDWNVWLSWTYNVVGAMLAVAGVLNPLLATLFMLLSSTLIESRSARILHRNYARGTLRQTHSWQGWVARRREIRELRKQEKQRAEAISLARAEALDEEIDQAQA
ncbi:heavy metal translocating P-type ATPase [Corynebacterium sp. 22_2729]